MSMDDLNSALEHEMTKQAAVLVLLVQIPMQPCRSLIADCPKGSFEAQRCGMKYHLRLRHAALCAQTRPQKPVKGVQPNCSRFFTRLVRNARRQDGRPLLSSCLSLPCCCQNIMPIHTLFHQVCRGDLPRQSKCAARCV